jgi:hypothetical protein
MQYFINYLFYRFTTEFHSKTDNIDIMQLIKVLNYNYETLAMIFKCKSTLLMVNK